LQDNQISTLANGTLTSFTGLRTLDLQNNDRNLCFETSSLPPDFTQYEYLYIDAPASCPDSCPATYILSYYDDDDGRASTICMGVPPPPPPPAVVVSSSISLTGMDAITAAQHLPSIASAIAASLGVLPSQVNITSVTNARRALSAVFAPRELSGGGSVIVLFTIIGNATQMATVGASIGAALQAPAFVAAVAANTGVQVTVTAIYGVGVPTPTPTPTPTPIRTCGAALIIRLILNNIFTMLLVCYNINS
jgi:hypothetical protein